MCKEKTYASLIQAAKFGELLAGVHRRKGHHEKARMLYKQSSVLRREVAAMKKADPKAGNIGKPIRHVELPGEEPLTVPDFDPAEEPPVETPATEPVPA